MKSLPKNTLHPYIYAKISELGTIFNFVLPFMCCGINSLSTYFYYIGSLKPYKKKNGKKLSLCFHGQVQRSSVVVQQPQPRFDAPITFSAGLAACVHVEATLLNVVNPVSEIR